MFKNCFRLSLVLFILISLTSCGDNLEVSQPIIENKTEVILQDENEGVYYFPNGGSLEVTRDYYGRITLSMLDQIVSVNPENGTLGEHPRTTISHRF
jgi:hypothetical protein